MSLERLLRHARWEAIVGARVMARAQSYLAHNRVGLYRSESITMMRAEIAGPIPYTTELSLVGAQELQTACSCPSGREGRVCAHVVATALAWHRKLNARTPDADWPASREGQQVEAYLETLDAATLRALLAQSAASDELLTDALLALHHAPAASRLDGLRSAAIEITAAAGILDWREADEYARGLQLLAVLLEGNIRANEPGLLEVIEEAIARAEEALFRMDASNGKAPPAIKALQQVHRRAAAAIRPDPVALGARLVELLADSRLGIFSDVLSEYAEVFGKPGLAAFRCSLRKAAASLADFASDETDSVAGQRERLAAAAMELAALDAYREAISRIGRGV